MASIKSIILIIITVLAMMFVIEFLPDIIEKGKDVTSHIREYGTVQGIVNDIQYGDPYTTVIFQNMMGESLTYKIENKYAGVLSIIQDSQQDKREIKIYFDQSNNIYDAEYIIK